MHYTANNYLHNIDGCFYHVDGGIEIIVYHVPGIGGIRATLARGPQRLPYIYLLFHTSQKRTVQHAFSIWSNIYCVFSSRGLTWSGHFIKSPGACGALAFIEMV